MKSAQDLRRLLESIDRKGYPAYKDTRGSYDFTDYVLSIDHVQGDPFASPSKLSVFIPVSYTHLDVYKRQAHAACLFEYWRQALAKRPYTLAR